MTRYGFITRGSRHTAFPWIAATRILGLAACAGLAGLAGCGGNQPPTQGEAGLTRPTQPTTTPRAGQFSALRHSILLDFDNPTDAVFIQLQPAQPGIAPSAPVTGGSLLLGPDVAQADVKLSSLLSGRPFPAEWTLLGGHFRASREVVVDVLLSVDGETILQKRQMLSRNRSTPVLLDLTGLSAAQALDGSQTALLTIRPQAPASIAIENLLLLDNHEVLSPADAAWTIERNGHSLIVDRPQRFRITLPADLSQRPAWEPAEIGALRLIVHQNYPAKRWVIYADGRSYEDGQLKVVGPRSELDRLYAEQHAAPALASVPEEQGNLLRQTRGDANNDGYNELLGAYQLEAKAGRLDVLLTPRTSALVQPVLEITGLPEGKLVITIEGRLIETFDRLGDGRVLITIPHKIQRPATVNVRVQ